MKSLIKKALAQLGYEIRKKRNSKDAFEDQKSLLGNLNVPITIFDVGAYDGSISLKYNQLFPNAEIHSFEPFQESFSTLKSNTSDWKNIKIHHKALGEKTGTSKFHSNLFAATNSLLATHEDGEKNWGGNILSTKEVIDVSIITIDDFLKETKIEKIDILKLDVQGAEGLILKGAEETIQENKINLIFTEMITIPTYQNQKEIGKMFSMYTDYGFDLFDLYNLSHSNNGQLQFFDAIFINSES